MSSSQQPPATHPATRRETPRPGFGWPGFQPQPRGGAPGNHEKIMGKSCEKWRFLAGKSLENHGKIHYELRFISGMIQTSGFELMIWHFFKIIIHYLGN
jgi:hypothetical protein